MTEKPKLLNQVRQVIRVKNYLNRTEQAYGGWIKRYILYHDKSHPAEMGALEVEAFLIHLLESGYAIRTIQQHLGHKDVKTTMIYTHEANRRLLGVRSPLDEIWR